ncbi:MAG: serine--tRNA ligase [Kiritimatiellae bacterium]|nr:serine--tRNA ligase [Kiritimatiellia bacterium]
MLDIRMIRRNFELVRQGIETRGADAGMVDRVLALDGERRRLIKELDELRHRRNELVNRFGKEGSEKNDHGEIAETIRGLLVDIRRKKKNLARIENEFRCQLSEIPNLPHPTVPRGTNGSADRVVQQSGVVPEFGFEPKGHVELGENLGILQFERAAKMGGRGQVFLVGNGARLARALVAYMLTVHTRDHGYQEVRPPVLCNAQALWRTAHLPRMIGGMYRLANGERWLVPDGEVPLLSYVAEKTISEPLPLRLVGWSMCFRDAGRTAGKKVRGLLRVHEFETVELFKCVEPSTALKELDLLVRDVADILERLRIPFRIVELCAGHLSFASEKAFRLDVWAAGQRAWLPVSTCRDYGDFLARRAGVRYRDKAGKLRFVHTVGGAGVAVPRLLAALMEQGQTAEGTITLPEVLLPLMDGVAEIARPLSCWEGRQAM